MQARLPACCLAVTLAAALSGCACFDSHKRPMTSYLDGKVNPETTTAKVLLSPVAVPVGFCSLLLDCAVVYPVSRIPEAYDDTMDALWRQPSGGYLRQTFLFVPKVVLTPVVFGGAFVGEGYFDL